MKKYLSTVAIASVFAAAIALSNSASAQQAEVKPVEPSQAAKKVNLDEVWVMQKSYKDSIPQTRISFKGDTIEVQTWSSLCINGKNPGKVVSKDGVNLQLLINYSSNNRNCEDSTLTLKYESENGKESLVNTSNSMRVFKRD